MERSYLQIIIFILLCTLPTISNASQDGIYKCFISGNMQQWKQEIVQIEKDRTSSDAGMLDILDHYYGYIGWCISNDKDEEGKAYMNKAEDILDKLQKKGKHESMILAYKSAFIGFQIQLTPYKAPFIGSKAVQYAEQSISIDANNEFGHQLLAHCLYYMPSFFGGSKDKALKHYQQAIKIFEEENNTENNWQYLQLLKVIADCYEYKDNKEMTIAAYEKILKLEPNFTWVKNKEYPRVKRKYGIAE